MKQNQSITAMLIGIAVIFLIGIFLVRQGEPQKAEPTAEPFPEQVATQSKMTPQVIVPSQDAISSTQEMTVSLQENVQFFNELRFNIYEKIETNDFEGAYHDLRENQENIKASRYLYVMSNLLTHWAHQEPNRVLSLLESDAPIEETDQVMRGIGRGFAIADSTNALIWLQEAEDSGLIKDRFLGDYIYLTILEFHAETDPEFVVEALNLMEEAEQQVPLLGALVKNLSAEKRPDLVEWALDIPPGPLRIKAMESLLDNHPDTESLVRTMMSNRDKATTVEISEAINLLGQQDFQAAEQLIMAEPVENTPLLKVFIADRINNDGDEVHRLINELENPVLRDDLIGSLSRSLASASSSTAISTASNIENGQVRKKTISDIIASADTSNLQYLYDYFDEFDTMTPAEIASYRAEIKQGMIASQ